MKKIMIAAAIVCAAVATQAASFQWKTSSTVVNDFAGTSPYSGAATLYAYETALGASTAFSVDTATMSSGAIATTPVFTDARLVADKNYTFYYTLTDAKGNTYTSGTKAATAQLSSTPLLSIKAGSWTAAPEPTSAMLMLLGLAGLALKRKQA